MGSRDLFGMGSRDLFGMGSRDLLGWDLGICWEIWGQRKGL